MTETKPKSQVLELLRRIALWAIIGTIAYTCAIMAASWGTQKLLTREIQKIKTASEPLVFSDFQKAQDQTQTDQGARKFYEQALSQMRPENLQNISQINSLYKKNIMENTVDAIPDEVRKSVNQMIANMEAIFSQFDTAAALPISSFDFYITEGADITKAHMLRVETAQVILSLRTMEWILQQQHDMAAKSLISNLKVMRVFEFCPTIFLQNTRTRCFSLICQDIQVLLAKANPSENLLKRIQKELDLIASKVDLRQTLYAERVYQIQMGKNLLPEKKVDELLNSEVYDIPGNVPLPSRSMSKLKIRFKYLQFFKEMARAIKIAAKPWPEPLSELVVSAELEAENDLKASVSKTVKMAVQGITFLDTTRLNIAYKRYEKAHGSLPDSPEAIEGEFIESIPVNPATGKKFELVKQQQTEAVE